MSSKKKPEPPLIDERHDRLVETPGGDKETPVEGDVEQAEDDLNDDDETSSD